MGETREFYGKGNPIMEVAFRDCINHCYRDPDIRKQFETETGNHFPTSGFDALIDESTGHDKALAKAFIQWVIDNVWGRDE